MADVDESTDLRFLITTDTHAGYGENKKFISEDSFNTLREVFEIGASKGVDFVLLGGDLFHENTPSRETQLKVTRLLRQYCLREGELSLEFVSDPTINFPHSNFPVVNYEDQNLNVHMPIFTIHGNHDDLSGKGLTALDVLHEAGLINLFGKFSDVDNIEVSPILLRKGKNKVAIYGIGSQRDDRLCRAFIHGSVRFLRPDDDPESWFSILVLHQNRPPRTQTRTTFASIPTKFIPSFLDLVIWGHEHECKIDPEFTALDSEDTTKGFFIIQPGSTVATSMNVEETVKKHIGIITVREKEFRLKKIELKTTRQIIVDEISLGDGVCPPKLARSTVRQKNMPDEELVAKKIEQILKDAETTRKSTQPYPPRIRLKVNYEGKWLNIPPINGRRFGSRYMNEVANATEMISVKCIRDDTVKKRLSTDGLTQTLSERADEVQSVDEMVEKYFTQCAPKEGLRVLSEVEMSRAMKEYSSVETQTYTSADRAFTECVREQISKYEDKIKRALTEVVEVTEVAKLEDVVEKLCKRRGRPITQPASAVKSEPADESMPMHNESSPMQTSSVLAVTNNDFESP